MSEHRPQPSRSRSGPPAPRRTLRTVAAAVVALLLSSFLALTGAGVANAAPGDFSLSLAAPASVPLGDQFNYTATLKFEGVDLEHPATGVVLTSTLPVGVAFVSVPTSAAGPVSSFTYDEASRLLTLTLADTTQSVVAIDYTVSQIDNHLKHEGTTYVATITGTGGPTGAVTSDPVTTKVTGNNDYTAAKSSEVITGGSNRVVTYRFNVYNAGSTANKFSTSAQELTDVFPAGVVLLSQSTAFGSWSWTTNPTTQASTAVWTRSGLYGPDGYPADPNYDRVWLTVEYPASVPGWENGKTPPLNVVTLSTTDTNGVKHGGAPAAAQSIAFADGDGPPRVAIAKVSAGYDSAGGLSRVTSINAAYVGKTGDPDAEKLIITDSGATGEASEAWFEHMNVQAIWATFSQVLITADLPYTVEYQTDRSSTWTQYTGFAAGTNTTSRPLNLTVQNVGSSGWGGTNVLDLPIGSTVTGFRITVDPAPGALTKVPVNSEVRVKVITQPVLRGVSEGNVVSPTVQGVAPGVVSNTASITDGTLTPVTATDQFTPVDSLYLTTIITGPSSMAVGGTGAYVAHIVNQNPSETYKNPKMSVVLPCGIQFDPSQPITPQPTPPATATVGVEPAPAINDGVTVDATQRVDDANGCAQQVVTFSFDEIKPMRGVGAAKDRWVESSGWQYKIPVVALAQSFVPGSTVITAKSFVYNGDPRFNSVADGGTGTTTVPMLGYGEFFAADTYNFDPARPTIAVWSARTSINAAGGLLVSKLSSASASGPWALSSPVGSDAFWQIYVSDILPNPATALVFFDKLPAVSDGDEFATTLSGLITGAPAAATIEYSNDATSADSGTWRDDNPAGATSFKVSVPTLRTGDNFTLVVPTTVVGSPLYGASADNQVFASGQYGGAGVSFSSNKAVATVQAAPSLSIVKTTNGIDVPDAASAPFIGKGTAVQWDYLVTNTGNTTLSSVGVTDVGGPDGGATTPVAVTAPVGFTGTLAPGEVVTFTAQSVAIEGLYSNTATVTGVPSGSAGEPIPGATALTESDSSWYRGAPVDLSIQKQVSTSQNGTWSESVEVPKDSSVWWKITVTNNGSATLANVNVTDPTVSTFGLKTLLVLAPGESRSYVFEQKQLGGPVTNVGYAAVQVGDQTIAVSDDAQAKVTVPVAASLTSTGFDGGALLWSAMAAAMAGALLLLLNRLRGRRA